MKPRDIQPFATSNTCFLIALSVQLYFKSLGIPSRIIKHNLLGRDKHHCEVVFDYEGELRMYDSNKGTSSFSDDCTATLETDAIKLLKDSYVFEGNKKNRWSIQARWLTPVVE